eukprot:TRINITY_DN1373_c2_g1_i1.p1 TRINITY_DN1373_c2_g1~~TRINITY_DN1373_c2_g1_i1.p1  ORF type:complete len:332 (-),score=68.85 TRINITY_DN1373_c2_g1_i1:45-1040(-)
MVDGVVYRPYRMHGTGPAPQDCSTVGNISKDGQPVSRLYMLPVYQNHYAYVIQNALHDSTTAHNVHSHQHHHHHDTTAHNNKPYKDRMRDKAMYWTTRATDKVQEEYTKWGEATPTSWIGRAKLFVHGTCQKLLDKVEPEETFLKSVDTHVRHVDLLYPSSLSLLSVQAHFHDLFQTRTKFHDKWMWMSIACVPFSLLAGILPGPNVFLLYNAYRIHSHWKASKASSHLRHLLSTPTFTTTQQHTQQHTQHTQQQRTQQQQHNTVEERSGGIVFVACEHLERLTRPELRISGGVPLSDEEAAAAGEFLELSTDATVNAVQRTRVRAMGPSD